MLVACWSSKGGSGTTVIAAALALTRAERGAGPSLLADLAGDLPAVLGLTEPDGPGLAGWLAAGPGVPADALSRLELEVSPHLHLLARGKGLLAEDRAEVLAALLGADPRTVVVDCGTAPQGAAQVVAAEADRSILVTRPCFLSLRRALESPVHPSQVVLVTEPGRAIGRRDVERCLGAPVVATVEVDPAVARAVDAGLLTARLPRALARELRAAT